MIVFATVAVAKDAQPWLPKDYRIPDDTLSPDKRYGVMLPEEEGAAPDKLVELKDGRVVATMAGGCGGWSDKAGSMPRGKMEAIWSEDQSMLCWVFPDKWFPRSYVALKLHDGKMAWQIELMKAAQTEILTRTEAAAPRNFAAVKLETAGNGSAYPEGFSIDVSQPDQGFRGPLVCQISLTSNSKESENEPEENGLRAWLTMTISEDGSVGYSDFKVKQGQMSAKELEKVAQAAKRTYPLIDTDIGKGLRFSQMTTRDGRYGVGWTVRPKDQGSKPVDWTRWNAHDPDQLLRHYDWQHYLYYGAVKQRYEAINFVIDLRKGSTMELPMKSPHWLWKKDGWEMASAWIAAPDGRRFGLMENGQEDTTEDLWLVSIGEKGFRRTDLMPAMRTAVNGILRERRPMVANPDEFFVKYNLGAVKKPGMENASVRIPFVAEFPSSDKREFGLRGDVTVNPGGGNVTSASSDAKQIDPFVNNEELMKADAKLNELYRSALESIPPGEAEEFKQKQRAWIEKRDKDANQAVNMTPYSATFEECEQAREKSLLESTKQRIDDFVKPGVR